MARTKKVKEIEEDINIEELSDSLSEILITGINK